MEIVEIVQKGDPKVLREIISREIPKHYNFCLRLTQNRIKAADLCQSSFSAALQSIKKKRPDSSLIIWLYRTTLTIWKNKYSEENYRRQPDAQKPAKLEISETSKELYQALDQLDPELKALVILKDIENLSLNEIAKIINVSVNQVRGKLVRARDRLRERFKRLEGHLV